MTKLADFSIRFGKQEYLPVVTGGMGVDISTSELALSAARIGAIGHISDAMAPYISDRKFGTRFQNEKRKKFLQFADSMDKSQVKWDFESVYEANLNHCRSTMEAKTGSGAVFINVMEKLNMGAPAETLRARLRGAMDGGIDGITLSAGLHNGTLKLAEDHPRFRDVKFGIIVSSARALKIFLRGADRVKRAPDYIIVEGPLAGGHLGFGEDWKEHDLKSIVKDVLAFLEQEGLKIPVIPAGGVFTGTDACDFLALGASAVQVATRFTISQECGLPDKVKQEYLRAREEDVVVNSISPTGYLMRMLSYSPCIQSNVKPNCEALGYILDRDGKCLYHGAYERAGCDAEGNKLPVTERMCICYHFMKFSCYTCGHNVYRLKDTTVQLPNGEYYLPSAEHILTDYLYSEDHSIKLPHIAPQRSAEQAIVNAA
ncbi:MAG: nitronate monooxygenase [Bdellovibrionota bacterium]